MNQNELFVRRIHPLLRSELRDCKLFGIVTETGRARWAYVNAMSGGQAAQKQDIRDSIRLSGNPDARIKTLIDEAARSLRENGIAEPVRS